MCWKIFAVVSSAFTLWGLLTPAESDFADPWLVVGTMFSIPAGIGLILYAFNLTAFPMMFWRPFAWAYAAWSFVALGLMVTRSWPKVDGRVSGIALVLAVGLVGAVQYFRWLALRRYASRTQTAAA